MLARDNAYVQRFQTAHERLRENDGYELRLQIQDPRQGGKDPRRYNRHAASEVGVIMPEAPSERGLDITLQQRAGGLQRISDLDPAMAPCRFPLIHTKGEIGWFPGIPLAGNGIAAVPRPGEDDEGQDGNYGDGGGHDGNDGNGGNERGPNRWHGVGNIHNPAHDLDQDGAFKLIID